MIIKRSLTALVLVFAMVFSVFSGNTGVLAEQLPPFAVGYDFVPEEADAEEAIAFDDEFIALANLYESGMYMVPEEVIALADSLEHAREIAAAYGLEFKSYAHGVAVLLTPSAVMSVFESQSAFTINANLPPLSFNMIYTIDFAGAPEFAAANTIAPAIDMNHWQHEVMDNERAWDLATGEGVVVAVIDTGIDINHPAFAGRILPNSFNSHTNQVGLNAVIDDEGHGTHVAGIVASAPTATSDVSGVAPDAYIMKIKANDPANPRSFTSDALFRGINYAVDNGADIINMSLGRHFNTGPDPNEQAIIVNAVNNGVTVIAAAGNDRDSNAGFPAAYPEVIAVSSVRWQTGVGPVFDDRYSNFGPQIDLAAPGTDILAPIRGGGYGTDSGTSMAAPNVAGAAALLLQRNPLFTPQQIRDSFSETVHDAGELGRDDYYGYGIVDSYALLVGADNIVFHEVTFNFNDSPQQSLVVRIADGRRLIRPPNPVWESNVFSGWGTAPTASIETLFGFNTPITEDLTLYAWWNDAVVIAAGTVGTGGAPWRLYSDGTLVVEPGFIELAWSDWLSPWYSHRDDIFRIVFTGPITAGLSLRSLFSGLHNVAAIEGLGYFETAAVTNMQQMFQGASSLTELDLSGWDTEAVRVMASMFTGASSLTELDLSGWDTRTVTHMQRMFEGASSLTELDLSNWDTGAVLDMSRMFRDASSLMKLDLSGWNTSSVTTMIDMFSDASALINLDLSCWNTGAVTRMDRMFSGAASLAELDLSGWDTSAVNNMNLMFQRTNSLHSITFGKNFVSVGEVSIPPAHIWRSLLTNNTMTSAGLWDYLNTARDYDDTWTRTDDVKVYMFGLPAGTTVWFVEDDTITITGGRSSSPSFSPHLNTEQRRDITTINITGDIYAGGVMVQTFTDFSNLAAINGIERINTESIWSMNAAFARASSLAELDLSSWDTGAVTDMRLMFAGASSLSKLNLSGWDTSLVTNMEAMFSGTSLTELDLSDWNTERVTNMRQMFALVPTLTKLNLSGWDTGAVTDMSGMFFGSSSLQNITFGRNFVSRGDWSLALPANNWQNLRTGEIKNSEQLWDYLRTARDHDDTWMWESIAQTPLGDVNDDGVVNITDLTTLRLYLAGHNITINHTNANLNNDQYVNAEDAELLRQQLAGHPVTFD